MIEVEVKAKIDNFEDMRKKLNNLGAIKTKEEFQEDIYFNSPIVDFAKTDEALRIRTTKQSDEKHIFITYKGAKIDSESKTREEIEFGIEDSKKCAKTFEHIGFKKVRTVRKNREYYAYKNFEISLDDIEGLDPYMEIEIGLEDGNDSKNLRTAFLKCLNNLGLQMVLREPHIWNF